MSEQPSSLDDFFGGRRPPLGPATESAHPTSNDNTPSPARTSDISDELDTGEWESPTLDGFLASRDQDSPPPSAEESETPMEADLAWHVRDLLLAASPAPRTAGRHHSKATRAELAQLLAPAVTLLSLRRGSGTITVREAWDAVPEPKPNYRVLNSVGDALGNGRGRHALRLRRGARRAILVCQENVHACTRRMADTEVRNLAEQLGYATREQLLAAVDTLPHSEF
jgi:hypothetical protein